MRNLQELKNEQDHLREVLIDIYKSKRLTVRYLSFMVKVPYSTLRMFLLGTKATSTTLFKIKDWIDANQPNPS